MHDFCHLKFYIYYRKFSQLLIDSGAVDGLGKINLGLGYALVAVPAYSRLNFDFPVNLELLRPLRELSPNNESTSKRISNNR